MNHISQLIDYQVKVSIETFPTLPILRFEGGGEGGVNMHLLFAETVFSF